MHVSFVTNIISIHQMNLWDNFICCKNVEFTYLYTKKESDGKRYSDYKRDYCIFSKCVDDIESFLDSQDIIIVSLGSIEDERINDYLKGKTNLIIYSEHISKNGALASKWKKIRYRLKRLIKRPHYFHDISRNNLVLCASSHAGYDYHITGFSKQNIYKFGYFPKYSYNNEIENNHNIVFSGRNIYFKHPEDSLFALNYLNNFSNDYILNVAGQGFNGNSSNHNGNVNHLGELSHAELVKLLFKSDLFVFSSTREEGWGVTLAEAMAAGCFVIANINAGSTNFLVKNGINGFTYKNKKELKKRLHQYVRLSIEEKESIRKKAVSTIKHMWNSEVAAARLYELCLAVNGHYIFRKYTDGPLSSDPCKF